MPNQVLLSVLVIFDDYEAVRDMLESPLWQNRYVDGWILERSFGKELGKLQLEL